MLLVDGEMNTISRQGQVHATEETRIMIADDHPLFLDALSRMVQISQPNAAIDAFNNIKDALAAASNTVYRIAIIDLRMPGMQGPEGVGKVRKILGCPIAIVSGDTNPAVMQEVIAAGASGFLPKTMEQPLMFQALQLILAGGTYLPEGILQRGEAAAKLDIEDKLTRREFEVLRMIVGGLQNKEIGAQLEIEEVTVKLHVRRIFSKLDVRNRTEAAMKAKEMGVTPLRAMDAKA